MWPPFGDDIHVAPSPPSRRHIPRAFVGRGRAPRLAQESLLRSGSQKPIRTSTGGVEEISPPYPGYIFGAWRPFLSHFFSAVRKEMDRYS